MKVLWIFVLVQTSQVYTTNAQDKGVPPRKCCNSEINLMHDNLCVADSSGRRSPIALNCEEKYILDPLAFEEDHYNVTKNGSLHVYDLKSSVSHDDFCLVYQQDEGEDDADKSHEVAVVCFPESEMELSLAKLTFSVKAVLIFISVAFLLLTLYVYYRLTELRETQDKVTIFCIINLTTFLFYLGIMQIQTPSSTDSFMNMCVILAFVVYFFTMGYFAWLNCVIANVWKTVVLRKWKIQERYWYILNHIYGWSVPFVMTSIVAVRHSIKPSMGITTCWFHHDSDQWSLVYLPISIMLALNVFLCLTTSLWLVNSDITPDRRKALRYKCILYLKLFLLGGFTWIFEVLSYTFNDHAPSAWIWMIVDFLNCLHGVLIFFVLILLRQRIRKELAGKTILCYTCPTKWADVENDEEVCLDCEGKGKYDLIIKTLK